MLAAELLFVANFCLSSWLRFDMGLNIYQKSAGKEKFIFEKGIIFLIYNHRTFIWSFDLQNKRIVILGKQIIYYSYLAHEHNCQIVIPVVFLFLT